MAAHHRLARPVLLGDNSNDPSQRSHELSEPLMHPPGHSVRERLRSALRDRGARSVRIRFRAARDGCRLRSYRVEPENAPLPAALTGQLRSLAHAVINESLPRPRHRGRTGDLTWTMESDLMEIRY